jgi:malonate-semialdehyde dehydrogenase (acetylating)/methylmalonate-semialdehyde dehydrogenase
MHAANLDEALALVNAGNFGNGASIFTASGAAAHRFRREVECGMVGINAGVPAPMAFISFGGQKNSFFGDLKAQGTEGVQFYTKAKAVIERWFGTGDV